MGACETVNCGRGAALTAFNLRVSKVFRLPHGMNIEAIAEGFNLFNAINPNFAGRRGVGLGVLHGHGGQSRAEHRVHEADALFRRRRSARAARRADWVQVYFLVLHSWLRQETGVRRQETEGPGAFAPGLFLLQFHVFCSASAPRSAASLLSCSALSLSSVSCNIIPPCPLVSPRTR